MPNKSFAITGHPAGTSIFALMPVPAHNTICSPNHCNDSLQSGEMRKRIQNLPYRLFLRCQCCSNLALVKFLQKSQFAFLEFSKHHRHRETQWLFQTKCRRCKETDTDLKGQPACELNGNFISIDQVARELSGECALVALHDDLTYFF